MHANPSAALAAIAVGLVASCARADTVTLSAAADNSIYRNAASPDQNLSNGAGQYIFAGHTFIFVDIVQRGLLRFDLSSIPPGAVVTGARLTLVLQRAGGGAAATPVALHRVLSSWGEGSSLSGGGAGGASTPGDASWYSRFYPGTAWTSPGGDFATPASAVQSVGSAAGPVLFASPALTADVQSWLDDPASQNGWILIGDETSVGTTRAFGSRDNLDPLVHPSLEIEFTVPCNTDYNQDGGGDNTDITDLANDVASGTESFPPNTPDFNLDGGADNTDVTDLANAIAGGPCP